MIFLISFFYICCLVCLMDVECVCVCLCVCLIFLCLCLSTDTIIFLECFWFQQYKWFTPYRLRSYNLRVSLTEFKKLFSQPWEICWDILCYVQNRTNRFAQIKFSAIVRFKSDMFSNFEIKNTAFFQQAVTDDQCFDQQLEPNSFFRIFIQRVYSYAIADPTFLQASLLRNEERF